MDSIQRIEITKGNNSVLYGNNSSAGTINIITDTLLGQKDSLFAKFTTGSFGKYEGAFSGTKTFENIFNYWKYKFYYRLMALEEIMLLVRETVALNLKE